MPKYNDFALSLWHELEKNNLAKAQYSRSIHLIAALALKQGVTMIALELIPQHNCSYFIKRYLRLLALSQDGNVSETVKLLNTLVSPSNLNHEHTVSLPKEIVSFFSAMKSFK